MAGRRTALAVLSLLVLLVLPARVVRAQEADLIHAEEPLWAPGGSQVWPQHFFHNDSFGCAHPIRLGEWRYVPVGREGVSDTRYRFGNYGVMHCWMNVAEAYETGGFESSRPGFLIELGWTGEVELWALQTGARPGSDYLLLARKPGPEPIARFDVLQRRCPASRVRGGPPLDILVTRYCEIGTKGDLVALARRMAKLPVLGTLTYERDPPADE